MQRKKLNSDYQFSSNDIGRLRQRTFCAKQIVTDLHTSRYAGLFYKRTHAFLDQRSIGGTDMFSKLKQSLCRINYKLFVALLVLGLAPTVYNTICSLSQW
jgi:hypothetical protein